MIERRLLDRFDDLRLRGGVDDRIEALAREHTAQLLAIADVRHDQRHRWIEVGPIARGKIIERDRVIAASLERIDHM